jgi:hypothetical protein
MVGVVGSDAAERPIAASLVQRDRRTIARTDFKPQSPLPGLQSDRLGVVKQAVADPPAPAPTIDGD